MSLFSIMLCLSLLALEFVFERMSRTGCESLSWSPQFSLLGLSLACQITAGLWTLSTVSIALQCTSPWCMYAGNGMSSSLEIKLQVSCLPDCSEFHLPLRLSVRHFGQILQLVFFGRNTKKRRCNQPTNYPYNQRTNTVSEKSMSFYNSFEVFISYESSYEN